jgi:hypothetical protein
VRELVKGYSCKSAAEEQAIAGLSALQDAVKIREQKAKELAQ